MTKSELYETFARTGRALASGKRLEMLELLAQNERSVQELASTAGLNLTTASAHLQVLREAGLVTSRRAGTRVIYRLSGDDVAELMTAMFRVAEQHRPEVRDARTRYLPDDVEVMNRAELASAIAEGRVTVVDVRPRGEYEAGHLQGAVSIPVDELPDRLAEIPADTEVVAYCRGRFCVMSHDAVRLLSSAGRSARVLDDGILEWRSEGVPTVASDLP